MLPLLMNGRPTPELIYRHRRTVSSIVVARGVIYCSASALRGRNRARGVRFSICRRQLPRFPPASDRVLQAHKITAESGNHGHDREQRPQTIPWSEFHPPIIPDQPCKAAAAVRPPAHRVQCGHEATVHIEDTSRHHSPRWNSMWQRIGFR